MSVAAESDFGSTPHRVDLSVPHHWQLSEHLGVQAEEARRICAPVCLKTVLEFKLPGTAETGVPLEEIMERTLLNGGRTEAGWLHRAEVATLRDFGLNAWRRDWDASRLRESLAWRREHYDESQLSAVSSQRSAEAAAQEPLEKARLSITDSIRGGNPVIASVDQGFSENSEPHQIVVHGYEEGAEGTSLLVTDPIIEDTTHQERLVAWDYFGHFFRRRAIFVCDIQ